MFGRNKKHLEQALKAQADALNRVTEVIDAMRVHAITSGAGLRSDDKASISLLVSAMMIAEENVRIALGRPHTFSIRPLYPPIDPEEQSSFARKVRDHLFGKD